MTSFSDRLREERKRLGLNQTDFAACGGVKRDAQQNYENGSRRPDSAYLEAIALQGVDVRYLLTGERNASDLSVSEIDLVRRYRDAPDTVRAVVLAALAVVATMGAQPQGGTSIRVQGDVGQYLEGDNTAPVTIDMSKGRKKRG
jgi:transcriptional regulator with XRE-family HTH domain